MQPLRQREAMMTLSERIAKAVRESDGAWVIKMADRLRFGHGLDYKGIFEFFKRHAPNLELPEFDELLEEDSELADYGERR
jgi:hypothetical protein